MKSTKINWKCSHCGARNIDLIKHQFDAPQTYSIDWFCAKCGKQSMLTFVFSISKIKENKSEN